MMDDDNEAPSSISDSLSPDEAPQGVVNNPEEVMPPSEVWTLNQTGKTVILSYRKTNRTAKIHCNSC